MLLAVDIGNSRIKFGVFDDGKLVAKLSIPTIRDISADALARATADKLPKQLTAAIISSVVPEMIVSMRSFVSGQYGVEALLVTNDMDFGLTIDHHPLNDAGSDRLVNAFAAVEKYGAPCIVCSFGTALTIDFVSATRVLTGGVIGPGMKTLATALNLTTSRLPEVEIEKPEKILQQTTVGSIQSGIVHGYFSLVDGLLDGIKKEIGDSPKVVATGGFAQLIFENTRQIDVIANDLTLEGLQLLYQRITVQA